MLLSPEHYNIDMMASGLLEFSNSVALMFDCGLWANFRNTLEIIGPEGRIELHSAYVGGATYHVYTKNRQTRRKAA